MTVASALVKSLLASAVLLLSACVNTPLETPTPKRSSINTSTVIPTIIAAKPESDSEDPLALLNDDLFQIRSPIESPAKLTRLNILQEREFFTYFNSPDNEATAPYERVANYLSVLLDGFNYSTSTNDAETTLNEFSGNCLSLTLLTTALAGLANVEIEYQLMDANPLYDLNTDYLLTSDHLRAVLRDSYRQSSEDAFFKSRQSIRIDFFNTGDLKFVDDISPELQISLYYSNKAVEHLSERRYDIAFQYARKAIELSKDNSWALNTLAILHRRKGDDQAAERIYLYGMRNYKTNNSIVRNYLLLLDEQSRGAEARALLKTIEDSSQKNPWQWINAGHKAFSKGDYLEAVRRYQKALSIAPDLHQLHLDTAKAYFKAGRHDDSRKHLEKAIAIAAGDADKLRYQQKLAALR